MSRWCYCSKVLPGKKEKIREHWKKKAIDQHVYNQKDEDKLWQYLGMQGFESWLQSTPHGDFMIHCLEGESLSKIFKGLREQILMRNPIALGLHSFYLDVLGKDYTQLEVEPHIELLLNISLYPNNLKNRFLAAQKARDLTIVKGHHISNMNPSTIVKSRRLFREPKTDFSGCLGITPTTNFIKRAFLYPLLPHKEEEHRQFRQEAGGKKRGNHEKMMQAFGVSHLSTWLQTTSKEKYIVIYTERDVNTPQTPAERLKRGKDSSEWQEIAHDLVDHTGLKMDELSPDVEWLTRASHLMKV